jgi:hypothetical protein
MTSLPAGFVKNIHPEPMSGCWLWAGRTVKDGYGRYAFGGQERAAHRVMYETARGPIPSGLVLDHLCRTPACVNPQHLEPVTNRENCMRGASPSVILAHAKRCAHGHDLTVPGAARRDPRRVDGWNCRACDRERRRRCNARKRTARPT